MDGKLITHPDDLITAIRERSAFRTYRATGINNTRYDFGTFHGHSGPLPDPDWDSFDPEVQTRMSRRFQWITGSLSDDHTGQWWSQFWSDFDNMAVDYVVYSYDTVIGWHTIDLWESPVVDPDNPDTPAHWTVTTTVHSATTSLHQTRLIQVIQQLGEKLQ